MREITDHKIEGLNDALKITVHDEPGHGGACHEYKVTGFKHPCTITINGDSQPGVQDTVPINFQNGPIKEHGVNGVSQEALVAVVIDRLRSFQAGPYSCRENAVALTHFETGLMWLQKRTRDRVARGVEGTSER